MRPQALALASFLAAALLCLCAAAAASPVSFAGGKFFDMEGMGVALDRGVDHLLVLAAVFVMCLFR